VNALSLGEWFFLALGIGGFLRFGWCLVYLIGTEAPPPAWLEKALDAVVGFVLAAMERARRMAVDALRLIVTHLEPRKGAVR
jgi:hypothetical protein